MTDYYRVRRLGNAEILHMHYSTTSDGIEFKGSATHPSAKWKPGVDVHGGPDGELLKHAYDLDIDLGELGKGETIPVINNLQYQNAFTNLDREWFETHVEHPTGHLSMIMLCADDMRITDASGGRSIGRDPIDPTPVQPTVIQDGSVIYWSIEGPLVGARYALSWTWSRRMSIEKV